MGVFTEADMAPLTAAEVRRRLAALDGWRRAGKTIRKEYAFEAYLDGIAFVDKVARLAERQNHHPDIEIGWRRVTLALTTHDACGLTERDFRLAESIDEL